MLETRLFWTHGAGYAKMIVPGVGVVFSGMRCRGRV